MGNPPPSNFRATLDVEGRVGWSVGRSVALTPASAIRIRVIDSRLYPLGLSILYAGNSNVATTATQVIRT